MGKKMKDQLNDVERLQRRFWKRMRDRFNEAGTQLELGAYTDYGSWMNCKTGDRFNHIRIRLDILKGKYRVMAILDGRKKNPDYSKRWFDYMADRKKEIEEVVNVGLEWHRPIDLVEVEIYRDYHLGRFTEDRWDEMIGVMRQQFKEYLAAFQPHMFSFIIEHGALDFDGNVMFPECKQQFSGATFYWYARFNGSGLFIVVQRMVDGVDGYVVFPNPSVSGTSFNGFRSKEVYLSLEDAKNSVDPGATLTSWTS